MKKKVRIKGLPKKAHGGNTQMFGPQTPPVDKTVSPGKGSYHGGNDPEIKIRKTLGPTDPENATLEAELGETVITDLHETGIPEFYHIGGKPHSKGGTPLNLPANSFIFSKSRELKIKDPEVLKMFGKKNPKKAGHTPAELSKTYNLNNYREILADKSSDDKDIKTAEMMIKNYNIKLGGLALAQESIKGFEEGLPSVAMPFIQSLGVDPSSFASPDSLPSQEEVEETMIPFKFGGEVKLKKFKAGGVKKRKVKIKVLPGYQLGGGTPIDVPEGPTSVGGTGSIAPPYDEQEWFSPDAVKRLNTYRKMYGLKPITGDLTKEQVKKAAGEMQAKIIEKNPELVADYMSRSSHKPNNKLIDLMKEKGIDKDYDVNSTEDIAKAMKAGDLSKKEVQDAYKDDLWWYRALETNVVELSPEEYKAKMEEEGAIKQDDKLFFQDDPENKQLYTEYVMKEEEPEAPVKEPREVEHLDPQVARERAPFWTEDLINMGVAGSNLTGIKKYMPWRPSPQFEEAIPAFTDFRGTAARIGSQLGAGVRGLTAFGAPQAMAASFANMQRGAVDPILQAQQAEYQTNQAIGNQFEMANTQAANQYNWQKAQWDKGMYDDTIIANQQFDNAKRDARTKFAETFRNAWTNRGKTAAMNSLFPDYAVDPTTGFLQHDPSTWEVTADSQGASLYDQITEIKKQSPGMTWAEATDIAEKQAGIQNDQRELERKEKLSQPRLNSNRRNASKYRGYGS